MNTLSIDSLDTLVYLNSESSAFPKIRCPITNEMYYSPLHLYYNLITHDEGIKMILKDSCSFSDIFLIRKNFKDFFIQDVYEKRHQEIVVINTWSQQYPEVNQGDLMVFSSIIRE